MCVHAFTRQAEKVSNYTHSGYMVLIQHGGETPSGRFPRGVEEKWLPVELLQSWTCSHPTVQLLVSCHMWLRKI